MCYFVQWLSIITRESELCSQKIMYPAQGHGVLIEQPRATERSGPGISAVMPTGKFPSGRGGGGRTTPDLSDTRTSDTRK